MDLVRELGDLGPERVRRLKRREYDALVELGLFEDERVELLRGFLVEMSPQGSGHAEVLRRLNRLLVGRLGDRAVVQVQAPLALGEDSEPEPDLAVIPAGDYSHAHPSTALLVVEVAESSLRKDRILKAALYAEAGIPEYWLVDLGHRLVEVHSEPLTGRYTRVTPCGEEDVLPVRAFPEIVLRVGEILPSR